MNIRNMLVNKCVPFSPMVQLIRKISKLEVNKCTLLDQE
jgi:hypothetical protein